MAEWSIAPVLKTGGLKGSVGSNPSLSANKQMNKLKKNDQLGMPFGTACGRLKKSLLFSLVLKLNLNYCLKCSKKIQEEDFSIDHIIDWMDSSEPKRLFFDLNNIRFSHRKCNKRRPTNKKYVTDEEKRDAKILWQKNWRINNKEKYKNARKQKYLKNGT